MSNCIACEAGAHWECFDPEDLEGSLVCCCTVLVTTITAEGESKRGGPLKDATEMRDPKSTGRKRAAQIKPITEGMVCEWAQLARAGGGVIPIIGCMGNDAKHIHHGPDKDTTNNSDENLHRVCHDCHNRWHTLNDPFYGERPAAGTPFIPLKETNYPHDAGTRVSAQVVFDHEMWWAKNPQNRTPYINLPKEENERPAITPELDFGASAFG